MEARTVMLSDFFQPLNLKNIIIYFLLLVFFEIFGSCVKSFFVKKESVQRQTSLINWLVGLGAFVFIWFILGFFIPPKDIYLVASIVVLFAFCIPSYFKNKRGKDLLSEIKKVLPALLLTLPFLPGIFVKASLPPYYADESAYHFMSPCELNNKLDVFWNFNGGALMNAPRLIDTFFIIIFSISKTYSIARLFLFSMFSTSLVFAYRIIKKHLDPISAFIFLLIFYSLPQSMVYKALPQSIAFLSTVGYVDFPAYSFMIIGFMSAIAALSGKKSREMMVISAIFWAMSLGSKYTTLNAFVAFALSLIIIHFLFHRKKNIFQKKHLKYIQRSFLALIVFGGYWYAKNFVIYGNPIYPFALPCWGKYAGDCGAGSGFFGSWTIDVTLANLKSIITTLLPGRRVVLVLSALSPLTLFFNKQKLLRNSILLSFFTFSIELFSLKYISGFYDRYHQHMQFFLLFPISIMFHHFIRHFKLSIKIKYIFISIFIAYISMGYIREVRLSVKASLHSYEVDYATGKTDIYDWIKKIHPSMSEVILWSEDSSNSGVNTVSYDPDMIWFDSRGHIRPYILYCPVSRSSFSINTSSKEEMIKDAKENKKDFYTVSINPCMEDDKVEPKKDSETEEIIKMRKINNWIVCSSKEIVPNLYYFDPN